LQQTLNQLTKIVAVNENAVDFQSSFAPKPCRIQIFDTKTLVTSDCYYNRTTWAQDCLNNWLQFSNSLSFSCLHCWVFL